MLDRQHFHFLLSRSDRIRLVFLALIAGAIAGGVSILYRIALSYAQTIRGSLLNLVNSPFSILLMFFLLIGIGIFVGKSVQSEPMISGSGIPQVEGQIVGYFNPKWWPVLAKKFIAGTLSIFCGLSLGREGPSIQLGAMAAQGFAEKINCSAIEKKYIITCGGCAGLAAAFQAPLSGLMFGLEEIHKNFSTRALFSAMVACLTADAFSNLIFGSHAVLGLNLVSGLSLAYYPLVILCGLFMGLMAVVYNRTLFSLKGLYKKTKLPQWARITIPFFFTGIAALFYPTILGSGDHLIHEMATGNHLIHCLLTLLIIKFLFSMICFCSGAPGGIFFPMLVLGSLCGTLFGQTAQFIFHFPQENVFLFMLLGMAGLFSGIVRAPLTGILLVVEMSGSFTQLFVLGTAAFVACFTADLMHVKPVYEQLLEDILPPENKLPANEDLTTTELTVSYRNPLVHKTLSEIALPKDCLFISIWRGGHAIIPHGNTEIINGDLITVICPIEKEAQIRQLLGYGVSPDADAVVFKRP